MNLPNTSSLLNTNSTSVSKQSSLGTLASQNKRHLGVKPVLLFNKTNLKVPRSASVTMHEIIPVPQKRDMVDYLEVGQMNLNRKYEFMYSKYKETRAINDLIYNEPMHCVSVFKDYLLLDDVNEFLKRPYTLGEQKQRLARLCEFYSAYS